MTCIAMCTGGQYLVVNWLFHVAATAAAAAAAAQVSVPAECQTVPSAPEWESDCYYQPASILIFLTFRAKFTQTERESYRDSGEDD